MLSAHFLANKERMHTFVAAEFARMAESVDALVSNTSGCNGCAGSTPAPGTEKGLPCRSPFSVPSAAALPPCLLGTPQTPRPLAGPQKRPFPRFDHFLVTIRRMHIKLSLNAPTVCPAIQVSNHYHRHQRDKHNNSHFVPSMPQP